MAEHVSPSGTIYIPASPRQQKVIAQKGHKELSTPSDTTFHSSCTNGFGWKQSGCIIDSQDGMFDQNKERAQLIAGSAPSVTLFVVLRAGRAEHKMAVEET